MKSLILVLSLLALSPAAFADQCAYNTKEHAEAAKALLKPGSQVLLYCEPCSRDNGKEFVSVQSAEVVGMEDNNYWLVTINGRGVDLAYAFLKTAGKTTLDGKDTYTNLSKMVGCPSEDVSPSLELN